MKFRAFGLWTGRSNGDGFCFLRDRGRLAKARDPADGFTFKQAVVINSAESI